MSSGLTARLDRLDRIGSDRRWLWLELALLAALGFSFAWLLAPEPFSDWAYYWVAANDIARYERGGAMLMLVGASKALGLPAHLAMVMLNLPAAMLVLGLVHRVDPSRGKYLAHLVAAYLILLTPYFGLVQLDLLAATCLVVAWVLLLGWQERPGWARGALAAAAIAAAVSTRPQFLLVLGMLATLLLLVWIGSRRASSQLLPVLLLVVFAGACGGFLLDSGFRATADRSAALRSNSAVTLYAGLLASSASYPTCGHWSEAATRATRSDLGKPLADAIVDRLRARPPGHWANVVACKSRRIVLPGAFAWGWLHASPGVEAHLRDRLGTAEPRFRHLVMLSESLAYQLLTVLIYAAAIGTGFRYRRWSVLAWLPVFWVGSFWCVHMVFEIQGRYFLSTLLLVPVLCALLMHRFDAGLPDAGSPGR